METCESNALNEAANAMLEIIQSSNDLMKSSEELMEITNDDNVVMETINGSHEVQDSSKSGEENYEFYVERDIHENESSQNCNNLSAAQTKSALDVMNAESEKKTDNLQDSMSEIPDSVNLGFYEPESFSMWIKEEYASKNGILYVSSLQEVSNVLTEYESKTNTKYCTYFAQKNFGTTDVYEKKHKIRWNDAEGIEFDGVPFAVGSIKCLDCQHGKNRRATNDNITNKTLLNEEFNSPLRLKETKKVGCAAQVHLKEIIKFPEFKIECNSRWKREKQSKLIRQAMQGKKVVCKRMFLIRLPSKADHSQHLFDENYESTRERIHSDVVMKIQELYLANYSTQQILTSISAYVTNELGLTEKVKGFNPQGSDIRNIARHVRVLGKLDKETIEKIKELLKDADQTLACLFTVADMRVAIDAADEDYIILKRGLLQKQKFIETFLFIYQTEFQQRLLHRYNQVLYIMEINCNEMIKRIVPYEMYVLVVQTSFNYQVVCTITFSKQRKNGLIEAFQSIKEKTGTSLPKYIFIDYAEKLIEAFEHVFPDATYFYTSRSCQVSWLSFCKQTEFCSHTEEILSHLNNIAYSHTEEALSVSAALFESSVIWQTSDKLRIWFQDVWLSNAKRWVSGYQPDDLHLMKYSKKTLKDLEMYYKDELRNSVRTDGLSKLLLHLLQDIPSKTKQSYIRDMNLIYENNEALKSKHITSNNNCWLDVPLLMLPMLHYFHEIIKTKKYTLEKSSIGMFIVVIENEADDVTSDTDEVVLALTKNVKNKKNESIICDRNDTKFKNDFFNIDHENILENGEFTVSFGDDLNLPFCTCSYWLNYKIPCLHMYIIFTNTTGWCYTMLSSLYRSNNSFQIDYTYIENNAKNETQMISEKQQPFSQSGKSSLDVINEGLLNQCYSYLYKVKNSNQTDEQKNISYQLLEITKLLKCDKRQRFVPSKDLKFVSKAIKPNVKIINPSTKKKVSDIKQNVFHPYKVFTNSSKDTGEAANKDNSNFYTKNENPMVLKKLLNSNIPIQLSK